MKLLSIHGIMSLPDGGDLMVNIIITAATTLLLSYILPGIEVSSQWGVLWFALVLGILNGTIGRLLKFMGCAVNFLTLGLFNLIVNALMVSLADALLDGIHINGFFTVILLSIILSVITSYFNREEIDRQRRLN